MSRPGCQSDRGSDIEGESGIESEQFDRRQKDFHSSAGAMIFEPRIARI
jgi:hypothetical protein